MSMNLEQEAREVALARGWDHANYVEAYGGDADEAPEVPARFAPVESFYLSAYEEGVTLHQEGMWQDGTPRD